MNQRLSVTQLEVRDDMPRMDALAGLFVRYRDSGDLDALGQVFDRCAPRLLSLALHLCGQVADAEDALQAAFVTAIAKAAAFDAAQPLQPWLAGILAGEAKNLLRRSRRRQMAPLDDVAMSADGPQQVSERRELVAMLRTHVEQLPEEQRQVLLLQLQHGMAPAEIAEVLGLPPGTVRVRLHRGVKTLRRWLPASLASMLFAMLPTRGLAAVRQKVMEAGEGATAAGALGAAAAIGGVLAMKKVLFVVVALAGALVLWTNFAPERAASLATSPRALPVAAVSSGATDAVTAHDQPAANTVLARQEVAVEGVLHVQARWDEEDTPVEDVDVEVWPDVPYYERPRAPLASGRTDHDGQLRKTLAAGRVMLEVHPSPQRSILAPDLKATIAPGDETTLDLLMHASTVTGRTIDETGAVVADAEIVAGDDQQERHWPQWRRVGHSDRDGCFRASLATDERIGARATGHAPSATQNAFPVRSMALVLSRLHGNLTGTVHDGLGLPISGARICVLRAEFALKRMADGSQAWPFAPITAAVDSSGAFAFSALEPTATIVRAEAPGFASTKVKVDIDLDKPTHLDIVLHGEAVLRVRAVDREGAAVSAARLALWLKDFSTTIPTIEELQTRADGTYEVHGLPPGPVSVRATKFGVGRATQVFDLREGEERNCVLQLEPRVGIVGRLVDARGEPLVGWKIVASDETWDMTAFRDRQQFPFSATTASDGAFHLQDLGPYPFQLTAFSPGMDAKYGGALVQEHVDPGPDSRVFVVADAALPSATVTGVIVGPDGEPAMVDVHPTRCDSNTSHSSPNLRTDERGAFSIGPLVPGDYAICVTPSDELLPLTSDRLSLNVGERRDLGILRLRAGAKLVMHVFDHEHRPWRATVPNINYVPDAGTGRSTWNSAGATIAFTKLEPGHGHLVADDRNLVIDPIDVDLVSGRTTDVDVIAHPGSLRRLRFTRSTVSADSERLRVRVRDERGRETTLGDAHFGEGLSVDIELPFLPGRFQVTAEDTAGNHFAGAVDVADLTPDAAPKVIPRLPR